MQSAPPSPIHRFKVAAGRICAQKVAGTHLKLDLFLSIPPREVRSSQSRATVVAEDCSKEEWKSLGTLMGDRRDLEGEG